MSSNPSHVKLRVQCTFVLSHTGTKIYVSDKREMKVRSEDCALPCSVSVYEPALSYAQFSRINIDKLVLTNNTKKTQVHSQFLHALESLNRVDKAIRSSDQETTAKTMETSSQLIEHFNSSARFLNQQLRERIERSLQWMHHDH